MIIFTFESLEAEIKKLGGKALGEFTEEYLQEVQIIQQQQIQVLSLD